MPFLSTGSWKLMSNPTGTSNSFMYLKSCALLDGCKASTAFSSRSKQLSTMISKRNGSSKTTPLYSIRTSCCGCGDRPLLKFAQHTSLINRFDQFRSHLPMNFNSRSDYLVTHSVCLLIQAVH